MMKPAILQAVAKRGLTSVMNATKWRELRDGVAEELPFAPAFQRKDVLEAVPYPEDFDEDASHIGDWPAGLDRCDGIEWIQVRPRRLLHRGRLVPDEVEEIEKAFVILLQRIGVPFVREPGAIRIYGYTADPGALSRGRKPRA